MEPNEQLARNWKVNLTAAWIAQFISMVGFTAAFPFFPFYIRELGVTSDPQIKLWTGLLASIGSVSMALMSPVWGVMADRRGRKLMVERAAFGGAIVLTSMAFVGNVHQLFGLRFIQGMLTGTVPAFITLVSSFIPAAEVGFALGLMQMAVFTGSSVGPMIGGVVADQLGYRWTFGVTGLLLLLSGILVYFVVQEKFAFPRSDKARNGIVDSARTIRRSLPVMAAIIALGGVYLGNNAAQPLLPLLVESFQSNPDLVNTATGTVYGASALASALSAALIGRMADRAGPRKVLLACGAGVALTYVGQALSPSLGILVAASFATGLFAGGMLPAANSILAKTVPHEQQGGVYGLSNSINAGGRALGPMLGASIGAALGTPAAFITAGAMFGLVTVWVALAVKPSAEPQPEGGRLKERQTEQRDT